MRQAAWATWSSSDKLWRLQETQAAAADFFSTPRKGLLVLGPSFL